MKPSSERIRHDAIISWALLLFTALVALAQLYTGSLTGTVTDPSGAPVPDAMVTLREIDRSTQNSTNTDHSGRYVFRALAPGKYLAETSCVGDCFGS